MKDPKFNYFKQKVLKHLNTLIQKEEKDGKKKETKKSFGDYLQDVYKAMGRGHLVPKRVSVTNPKTGKTFQTTVYINPNKKNGKKIYHADSKGARISLGKLKKQCEKCTNSNELMQLILDNRERFSDENGRPLPMVQELSNYVSQLNDKMESKVKPKNIKKLSKKKTVKEIENKVKEKLKEQLKRLEEKGDTFSRYTVNGEWTDERKKLHEKIIKSILSPEKIKSCTPKKGEKPKFIMFGGRGGSGKSWFTDKKRAAAEGREVMFDSDKYLILDADAIKEYIPEYEGWNAGEVHEESSFLNKEIKRRAFEAGLNIIIDGTMNYNPKKPDKVKNEMLEAKGKGYSLEAHYMFTPIQKSCVNAMNRFKTKKGDFSGRLVPTNILLGMQDNEKSFDSVKDIVDSWTFRDNQNFEAKLIAQKNK